MSQYLLRIETTEREEALSQRDKHGHLQLDGFTGIRKMLCIPKSLGGHIWYFYGDGVITRPVLGQTPVRFQAVRRLGDDDAELDLPPWARELPVEALPESGGD